VNLWPDPEKGHVGLVINAAGLFGVNSFDGVERHDPIKIASKATDIRWQLEVAIPFKWLRMPTPNPGDRIPITLAVREPKKKTNNERWGHLMFHDLVWSYSCNGNALRVGNEMIRQSGTWLGSNLNSSAGTSFSRRRPATAVQSRRPDDRHTPTRGPQARMPLSQRAGSGWTRVA